MDARLGLELAIGIVALDLEGAGLDSCFFAGVFIKSSYESKTGGSGNIFTKEGLPFIQAFAFDDGKVVRFEALDNYVRNLVYESADLTEQAVHTLDPAKQEVIAKLSGTTRYFDVVSGGMRIKPQHERDAIATADAKKAIDALSALPEADRPRIEITEKGVAVKLEDMSQAGWDALAKAGAVQDAAQRRAVAAGDQVEVGHGVTGHTSGKAIEVTVLPLKARLEPSPRYSEPLPSPLSVITA